MELENKSRLIDDLLVYGCEKLRGCGLIIVQMKPELKVIYQNQILSSFMGTNNGDQVLRMMTSDQSQLIYPLDKERILALHREGALQQKNFCVRYRIKNCEGIYCWIEEYGQMITDKEGNEYLFSNFYDITTLKEQKEWINHVITYIPINYFGLEKNGDKITVIYANEFLIESKKIQNKEYQERLFQIWLSNIHKDDQSRVEQGLKDLFSEKRHTEVYFRYRSKLKGDIYIRMKAVANAVKFSGDCWKAIVECEQIQNLQDQEESREREQIYDALEEDPSTFSEQTEQGIVVHKQERHKELPYEYQHDLDDREEQLRSRYISPLNTITLFRGSSDFQIIEYNIAEETMVWYFPGDKMKSAPVILHHIPESLISQGIVARESVSQCMELLDHIKKGILKNKVEIKLCNKDGTVSWNQLSFETQYNEQNEPIKAIGYMIDISEYKKVEEDYLNEIQKMLVASHYSLLGKSRINLTKDTVEYCIQNQVPVNYTNQKYSDMIGRIIDLSVLNKYKQDVSENLNRDALVAKFKEGKNQYNITFQKRFWSEDVCWVKMVAKLFRNPYSNDIMCFLYMYNVQKEMQEKILNQYVIGKNYEFVGQVNVVTGKMDGEFFTSGELKKKYGQFTQYDQVLRHCIQEHTQKEDAGGLYEKLNLDYVCQCLDSDSEYSYSQFLIYPTGKQRKLWQYRYLDGSRTYLLVTRSDITKAFMEEQERERKLEEALKHANEANEAKSEFLSRMSHDFKTPLNSIINLTRLSRMNQDISDLMIQNLEQVEIAGKFLLGMVNDILDMSAIEHGKLHLHPQAYEYQEFLSYMNAVIVPLCNQKDIHFLCNTGATSETVYVDKARFNQIFFNLLSNAIKFSPRGGTVSYCNKDSYIDQGVVCCEFHVRDNGMGMSENFLNRSFLPFEQEIHTGQSYEGSGLGLTIVKSIVEEMNGTIRIESEPGMGTEVIVNMDLPIATPEQLNDNNTEIQNEAERLKGKNVLVVEDYRPNRMVVIKLLEMLGVTCTWVDNGKKAVNYFMDSEGGTYDLILMDIRMPVMDGITATRLIRSSGHENAETIPIVAMTANLFSEDQKKAMDAGMNEYLTKPFELDRLKAVLIQQLVKS